MLDRAEALRAKRRAALARLDELTQSVFLEMFGDPVANPMHWPLQPLLTWLKYPAEWSVSLSTTGTAIGWF